MFVLAINSLLYLVTHELISKSSNILCESLKDDNIKSCVTSQVEMANMNVHLDWHYYVNKKTKGGLGIPRRWLVHL